MTASKKFTAVIVVAIASLFNIAAHGEQLVLKDLPILAEQDKALGLYNASEITSTRGKCNDCAIEQQALLQATPPGHRRRSSVLGLGRGCPPGQPLSNPCIPAHALHPSVTFAAIGLFSASIQRDCMRVFPVSSRHCSNEKQGDLTLCLGARH